METPVSGPVRVLIRPSAAAVLPATTSFSSATLPPRASSNPPPPPPNSVPLRQSSSCSSASSSSSAPYPLPTPEGVVVVGFIGRRSDDVTQLINRILDSNVFGSGNRDTDLSNFVPLEVTSLTFLPTPQMPRILTNAEHPSFWGCANAGVRGPVMSSCPVDVDGVRSEPVNGGKDVRSSDACSASAADHLVVMVHGILGCETDWKFAAEQFVINLPDKVIVHCSECNVSKRSLDGVDVMGERLAEEVCEVIRRNPQLKKISFVAHSVGGLVARYAIGILYRPCGGEALEHGSDDAYDKDFSATIAGLEPLNFITVATPHLGSRGHKQVPFLFGVIAIEKVASRVIHLIFRKTGKHLFLVDSDDGEPPLLQRMVDDCGNLHFLSALAAFKRRVAYSNVAYDHIVGWKTSSMRRNCELPEWEDSVTEKYPHIVFEERTKGYVDEGEEPILAENDASDMLEEILLRGLSRVSWEKVDVSFHTCKQRFAAHSVIQVKDFSVHSEGADIIQHMIDHFHT